MTTRSPRRIYDCKAYRRQSNIEIAEPARHLIALVRERIDVNGRIDFGLVDRVVINHRFVDAIFVDDSDWAITEWREKT